MSKVSEKSEAPAVSLTVRIFEILSEASKPISLSELSRLAPSPVSTMHRVTKILETSGLISKDSGSNGFTLGARIAELGVKYLRRQNPAELFYPEAEHLVSIINETVTLAVLQHDIVVFVGKVAPDKPVQANTFIGKVVYAHATASGKVFLANMEPEKFYKLYPQEELPARTPYTITNRNRLFEELEKVRQTGLGQTYQEASLGLCCLAAPVRDFTGKIVAVLDICVPTEEITPLQRQSWEKPLIQSAHKLSVSLGWQPKGDNWTNQ